MPRICPFEGEMSGRVAAGEVVKRVGEEEESLDETEDWMNGPLGFCLLMWSWCWGLAEEVWERDLSSW